MKVCRECRLDDVSLLIASYGRPRLLQEAIDSALDAAEAGAELIVSDDLSSRSVEIRGRLRQLEATGRIRVLAQPTNIGMAANWNVLLSAANRKYCYFLGDDDLLDTAAIYGAVRVVREHDATLAVTGFRAIAPDRSLLGIASSGRPVGPDEFRRVFQDVLIDAPSVALRFFHSFSMFICRDTAVGLPFDTTVGNGADRLFLLRNLFARVSICCCPQPVLQWRRPLPGATLRTLSSDRNANLRSNIAVARKLIASTDPSLSATLVRRLCRAAGLRDDGRSEGDDVAEMAASSRRLTSTGRRFLRLSAVIRTKLRLALGHWYRRSRGQGALSIS